MQPLECKLFKILIAKLAPSIGSVPEPNSSNRIKLFEVDELRISTMLDMCEEKVLKDSIILCSSPISAKTLSKTKIELFSSAGIKRPRSPH